MDVWRALDICTGSLGALKTLAINDSHHTSMASTGHPTYTNIILSSLSFTPDLQSLSIFDVPLHALMIPPAVLQHLEEFRFQLYNQASAMLDLLPLMDNLCRLDITCDADVEQFERIIELPTVASLTLRDGESFNALPLVWSLLHLDNLRMLSLSYEGNILDPAWPCC
ncbi:uncharacterized protein EV420DRAFT_1645640 [Desarmillaria tabescens]|uniref:Uncharacterized protein n=1 Tax=Armillaria tabescens TaxID=1929756 RepID=A0AA39K1V1_ARMTA|nr:uncharacterized protein EV420DRAFT_1645640 [Desarmillaria tabescens]KAK0452787.1 hypothetical protein EV420DRAFT_1645640 [Desarmillaria tabescens]